MMRPASPPRPRQPARTAPRSRQPSGGSSTAKVWGCILGLALGWFFLSWPAYAWHGRNDAGGWQWDAHTTAACSIWWGFLAISLTLAVVQHKAKAKLTAPGSAAPAPPVCAHRNKVPVESVLDTTVTHAQWCPDCETQLDADWRPAAIPAPGAGWTWRWWCTCGRSRDGWAASELTAKGAIDGDIAAHQGFGHSWRSEWKYRD